jgi:hypothetical protein
MADKPVGVGRRDPAFVHGREAISAGKIGAPRLLRSVTMLDWLNDGASPFEIVAVAERRPVQVSQIAAPGPEIEADAAFSTERYDYT